MIFALLVTPAATTRALVIRPYAALALAAALAAALAVAITWIGLTLAFYLRYPVSFDIIALGFVGYVAALAWRQVRRGRERLRRYGQMNMH